MLDELGIHTWHWGHGSFADEQRIAYALVGEGGEARAFGVSVHADGRVEVRDDLRARFGPARRTLFGMRERAWWAVEDDAGTWLRCDASSASTTASSTSATSAPPREAPSAPSAPAR